MKLRTLFNLSHGSLAAVDAVRHRARFMARLQLSGALFVVACMPSHAADTASGPHPGLLTAGGPAAGAFVAKGAAIHDVAWPATVVARAESGERLAMGGIDPSLPKTADAELATGGDSPAGALRLVLDTVPIRSVPEPSELALLGDGLLVLIAWVAGRQARRSRSMAAMAPDHEHRLARR